VLSAALLAPMVPRQSTLPPAQANIAVAKAKRVQKELQAQVGLSMHPCSLCNAAMWAPHQGIKGLSHRLHICKHLLLSTKAQLARLVASTQQLPCSSLPIYPPRRAPLLRRLLGWTKR